jgi:20S proteasome alpha/beta subunit
MTVCIAAFSEGLNSIVFAMDQMLTVGIKTGDMAEFAKGMRVHSRWFATYAGTVEHVPPIMSGVTNSLADIATPSVELVTEIFLKTYLSYRLRIAEQSILAPLNLDMQTFATMIAENDNEILRSLTRRLNEFDFDVEFLVGGFDANPSPRIFTISPPGIEGHHDYVGFWSIGSGSGSAVNNLMLRGYKAFQPLEDSIYQVAESKFVAESSLSVGQRTAIMVMRRDESVALINRNKTDSVRQIWNDEGRAPMPMDLRSRIYPLLSFFKMEMPPPADSQEKRE